MSHRLDESLPAPPDEATDRAENSPRVVGLCPWLPWPLSSWPWWTKPVRAERLAVLRIGLAAVLLGDVLLTYWPEASIFYGGGSLGSPELFAWVTRAPRWSWSVLRGVEDIRIIHAAFAVYVLGILGLLIGFGTRICAALVWVLSTSFANLNPYLENAGDEIRGITLFYLMLAPCGAVWSMDSRRAGRAGEVFVHPWPLRLLFVQMTLVYFMNGLYKIGGADWQRGDSLYYVLGDLTLARWSYAQLPIPYGLTRGLTWAVLAWEISFPVTMLLPWWLAGLQRAFGWHGPWSRRLLTGLRWLRGAALVFGAAFHLGIWISLEIGMFPPYMLCWYLPLLPWERWSQRHESGARTGCSTAT